MICLLDKKCKLSIYNGLSKQLFAMKVLAPRKDSNFLRSYFRYKNKSLFRNIVKKKIKVINLNTLYLSLQTFGLSFQLILYSFPRKPLINLTILLAEVQSACSCCSFSIALSRHSLIVASTHDVFCRNRSNFKTITLCFFHSNSSDEHLFQS